MTTTLEHALAHRGERLVENARRARLTRRELDVLTHVADGETNAGVARRIGVSESTAKFHLNNVLTKLSARSRAHAVALALRAGRLT